MYMVQIRKASLPRSIRSVEFGDMKHAYMFWKMLEVGQVVSTSIDTTNETYF